MSRNLVLCLDGTANEFKKDRTNVLNLAFAAVKDPNRQLLYYHPGVGTMAPSSVFTRFGQGVARIAGLAFGYGLEADLGCAYSFLIDQYQPGDQVFLFGFSRGAYTARALAALINRYGLLAPGNTALVPYAIRLLWRWHVAKNENDKAKWFSLSEQFKQTLSVGDCPIHFLGVWDTVSSVGWVANPMSLPDTARLPNVSIVRHAVSIDERRAFFRTNLVDKTHGEDRAEVWFPGVHCDVGGGYSEATSGHSKIALEWMLTEAELAGLALDPGRLENILGYNGSPLTPPTPGAEVHQSLTPAWWLAEFVVKKHYNWLKHRYERRPNLFRRRHFGPNPCIHESAWDQSVDYTARFPTDAWRRDRPPLAAKLLDDPVQHDDTRRRTGA